MKTACTILILAFVLIVSGCTSAAPAAPGADTRPAEPAIPDMKGTWSGPSEGYDEGTGFADYRDLKISMVITEQKGRIFAGRIDFVVNGTASSTGIAGAIGRGNRTFTLSEQGGGYCTGELTGPDTVEMTYMEDGSPYSIAIDTFTRQR